jgi:hypothetical protein
MAGLPSPLWIGAINGDAAKAANWSLGAVPTSGTTAYMIDGSMNVSGNALAGVTVAVSGPGDRDGTINLSGEIHLYVANSYPWGYESAIVNLAANSKWVGGFGATSYAGPCRWTIGRHSTPA